MATAIRRSDSISAPMMSSNMRDSMRLGLLAGSATLFAALVGMIVVFSELTYSLLERPLRRKGMIITDEIKSRQQAERATISAGSKPPLD